MRSLEAVSAEPVLLEKMAEEQRAQNEQKTLYGLRGCEYRRIDCCI